MIENGILCLIQKKGNFPLTAYDAFPVRPGHNNIVAISATILKSDEQMVSIHPQARNCYFENENVGLTLYKNYTQSNCFFECNLYFAQRKMKDIDIKSRNCVPWFFPPPFENPIICNPWEAEAIYQLMLNVPEKECHHCLPDCNTIIYKKKVTSVPLRSCDLSNAGVSQFCKNNNGTFLFTDGINNAVRKFYDFQFQKQPYFLNIYYKDTNRSYSRTLPNGDVFERSSSFDPFLNDIAKVQIYFKTATATEIRCQAIMTWTNYFSNVGGILGLVLGIGIISLFEIVWMSTPKAVVNYFFHKTDLSVKIFLEEKVSI